MRQTSLPLENLQAWSHFNDVQLFDVLVEPHIIADGVDKGGGLLAQADHAEAEPLVAVPLDPVPPNHRRFLMEFPVGPAQFTKKNMSLVDVVPNV